MRETSGELPMPLVPTRSISRDCAFIFLTEQCNLACKHCYVSAKPAVGEVMSWPIFERALLTLRSVGINDIRLTGGEPTVHPLFDKVVVWLQQRKFDIGITTNGVRFVEGPISAALLSGVRRCWVSIYGPTAHLHSKIGGVRAADFDALLGWVGNCAREGIAIGISVLLIPGQLGYATDLLSHALVKGVRRLRFIPLQPDGRGQFMKIGNDWSAWPHELKALLHNLRNHALAKEFEVITLNDLFDLNGRYGSPEASCLLIGRRMWAIGPTGEVYPCCYTYGERGRAVGNIFDPGIVDVLSRRAPLTAGMAPCRALAPGYWQNVTDSDVTCPISKVEVKAVLPAQSRSLE